MLLQDKIAVIYGARGAIGGAVAKAFADEGATVIDAQVDALDEAAIDAHLDSVERVDISFNAIGLPDAVGIPFTEIDVERFQRPISAYTTSYLLTARLAARRMIPNRSGVIMTVSALPGRTATPLNGGYGPAQAAKEQLTRDLSFELAPHGIRVVGLRPHGLPETRTMRAVYENKPRGMTWEEFQAYLASTSHPRRTQTLDEVGTAAAFLASDHARGLTGTTVNLTMGGVAD
ncbi:SDR family NAD(P)-dependent oxidoreductase [Solirubrobacter soli]|uniref:SDR family NAD(P)-dependent oxidoreductase n=1 Tax=Solirubrobacter soli TaxID=363832 RepID=UPI000426BD33|nr:SDR family oxidoreductase [Solirubrobacter soli]